MSGIAAVVVSDLHIGDGSRRDDFHDGDFDGTLDRLERFREVHPDTPIVLNGDIVDGWRYGLDACFGAHSSILSRLDALHPIWVIGNHDEGVDAFCKKHCLMPNTRFFERFSVGHIWFLHGHQFDPVNSDTWSWVGRSLTRIAAWIGKLKPSAEDRLASAAGKIEAKGRFANNVIFRNSALDFASQYEDIHTIVCGHTHRYDIWCDFRGQYINTGYGLRDRRFYAIMQSPSKCPDVDSDRIFLSPI